MWLYSTSSLLYCDFLFYMFLQHKQRFNSVDSYQKLSQESEEFWKSLMHDIQKKHKIVVQGVPSVKLQKEMADEEKKRIAKQVRMGEWDSK